MQDCLLVDTERQSCSAAWQQLLFNEVSVYCKVQTVLELGSLTYSVQKPFIATALNLCLVFKLIFNVFCLYKQVWKSLENKVVLCGKSWKPQSNFCTNPGYRAHPQ